jgi:peptidoglycan hydrolase-like protein with peptidoglycan-binding domain
MKTNTYVLGFMLGLIGVVISVIPFRSAFAQSSTIPLCEITRNLSLGVSGEDVKCLQRYLNWSGYTVSTTGAGSPGSESIYFGTKTADAVKRWQDAHASSVLTPVGMTSGSGYWGQSSFSYYVRLVQIALGVAQ